jgi:hypothetical protein
MVEIAMTLEQFLNATAGVPDPVLRSAMTVALSVEPARTPEAYRRFYDRVVHELGLDQWAVGRGRWAGKEPTADYELGDNGRGTCS